MSATMTSWKDSITGNPGAATYCPEDNKLRLYVGRVPRPEYDALRAEGWTSTPKQTCDFVAVWTPQREDTALAYAAGVIDDEDIDPGERAADRAERFQGYQGRRIDDARGHADRFDGQDAAHGYQSTEKAERAAARHDRIADRAVNAWGKAEYWQRRTEGVIAHALYVSEPGVRMGRIKKLEAEQRKHEAGREEHRAMYAAWQKVADSEGAGELLPLNAEGYADGSRMNAAQLLAYKLANRGGYMLSIKHPDAEANENGKRIHGECWHGFSAYSFLTEESYGGGPFRRLTPAEYARLYLASVKHPEDYGKRWSNHYALRLAYERQMLAAQGGRAGELEIVPGGFIGPHQIQKVNKSPATGRAVSVVVRLAWGFTQINGARCYVDHGGKIDVERLPKDAYRAPTADEMAAFTAQQDAKPKPPPLVNLTDEDAERIQAEWNAHAAKHGGEYRRKPAEVMRMTQAEYSRLAGDWVRTTKTHGVKIRTRGSLYGADHVIVLTDKPRKALPASAWKTGAKPEMVTA